MFSDKMKFYENQKISLIKFLQVSYNVFQILNWNTWKIYKLEVNSTIFSFSIKFSYSILVYSWNNYKINFMKNIFKKIKKLICYK